MARAESNRNERGPWRFSSPVLVASRPYPPLGGGSSTIMKNLLDWIDPEGIVLAVQKPHPDKERFAPAGLHRRNFVEWELRLPGRVEQFRQYLLRPHLERRLVTLGRQKECGAVVGVFPGLVFLDAACRAARRLRVPFISYLHDTVAESQAGGHYASYAVQVQRRIFSNAARILVATKGMAGLYREKYGIEAAPVLHIYPESVPDRPPDEPGSRDLFWSGNIYDINAAAGRRVYEASAQFPGVGMTVASLQSRENLVRLGFSGERVHRTYIPVGDRQKYLDLLRSHGVLMLALSWPDESSIHEDELRTIFPTKTPEYLASGRPILVHCPGHYYLAKFFKENGCGEVVTERSGEKLRDALRSLLENREKQVRLGEAALRAVREFEPERVMPVFHEAVQGVLPG